MHRVSQGGTIPTVISECSTQQRSQKQTQTTTVTAQQQAAVSAAVHKAAPGTWKLSESPYLRRLSFFSSLVKQLSRCLFMYCSRTATSQTGHSTESKGEGIHWCGWNSKEPMFSSEKLTVGTATKHTSPELLPYCYI